MKELPFIEVDGVKRVLGCLPPKPGRFRMAQFADNFPVLSREQWQEMDFRFTNVPVLDQGHFSSCLGNATASGCMISRGLAGRKPVTLSAGFIYAQINGGRDAGAVVSDAFNEIQITGTCTAEEVGEAQIYKSQILESAYITAKKYRAAEVFYCPSFDSIMTAITLGFPVIFGIVIGRNFINLDNDGVVPSRIDMVLGGHALVGYGSWKSSKYGWVIRTRNSWTKSFGLQGDCFIPETYFRNSDAFAIKSMISNQDDIPDVILSETEEEPNDG